MAWTAYSWTSLVTVKIRVTVGRWNEQRCSHPRVSFVLQWCAFSRLKRHSSHSAQISLAIKRFKWRSLCNGEEELRRKHPAHIAKCLRDHFLCPFEHWKTRVAYSDNCVVRRSIKVILSIQRGNIEFYRDGCTSWSRLPKWSLHTSNEAVYRSSHNKRSHHSRARIEIEYMPVCVQWCKRSNPTGYSKINSLIDQHFVTNFTVSSIPRSSFFGNLRQARECLMFPLK